jgi:hypothetical protein
MGKKSSILAFRAPMPAGMRPLARDRKPTQDELQFVRAMARRAAQDFLERERAGADETSENRPCE